MRERLLKTLAVVAFGLISFPIVLTGDAHSFGNVSPLRLLVYYAGYTVVFTLGFLFGKATKRHKRLLIPARLLGAGTFFLALLLLPFTDGVTAIFTVGAGAVFWYFLGERASRRHYADFYPLLAFGISIFATVASYFVFSVSAPEELLPSVRGAVVVSFMVELILAALLINQSGIYDKASRRRETKATLPRGLSGYNAALVLVVTGAGLFLYLFTDKIVWLLREAVRLVVTFILYLLKMAASPMETVPGEEGDLSGLLTYNEPDELWSVLAPLIALVLLIVFRKQIWAWLKSVGRAIRRFFERDRIKEEEPLGFIDLFETIPSPKKKRESLTDAQLARSYRSENDPIKKYRLGYRLLLRRMNAANARLAPSDTAAEQREKGRKIYGEGLDPVVGGYNKIRYHDETADETETAALETILENGRS
ncbi:MAG: hypothetical protein NC084_12315 [Bacteroides sp.]|nr:hypothetical protein [Eubacterium sp.]MCM1419538.1 hypothetical protein [Roseburia sp.]MCM1463476.1 hypothetical protein [Bacteroides sp.]